jgi:hypothetical protein
MKDNIRMIKRRGMGIIFGQMEIGMKENSRMI